MFKNVYLDHFFNQDQNFKFFRSLGKRGFTLRENTVKHPGGMTCRFMFLGNEQYLEFLHVRKGSKNPFGKPGISLGYKENLARFQARLEPKIDFKCQFEHRNYDWKENSQEYLPGWNFLSFSNTGIRAFYPWFTEYERRKKKSIPTVVHPNSVYGLYGVDFNLTDKGENFFSSILSKRITDGMRLVNGNRFFFRQRQLQQIQLYCSQVQGL